MIEIREDTISLFEQDKEYVLDYLKGRNLNSKDLKRVIQKHPFGLIRDTSFFIDDEEYGISHFLGKSETSGYDIRKVNAMLNTEDTDEVVFALVIGGDALTCNIKTKEVSLWLVQTDNGNRIRAGDSISKFIKTIEE